MTTDERKERKERNSALDITRIIAVLAVIMIHVSSKFVVSYDISSVEFLCGNIFDSISRIGVPLFVMISGSLMLDEERNVNIKQNIKSIVCLLLFWSIVYCFFYNIALSIVNGGKIDFYRIVDSFINGCDHMWYLYMIIVLYLATPFLRMFVKKENKRLVLSFIAISTVTQFSLPIIKGITLMWQNAEIALKFVEQLNLGFFSGFVTYYLIGWYIIHIGIKKKWIFYCLGIFSLLVTILYVQSTKDYSNGYSNMNVFVLMYAVSVFILINCQQKMTVSDKTKSVLAVLSNLTFGVYIVHPLIQTIAGWVIKYVHNPFAYIICSYSVVVAVSFAVCFIVSKIPIIKKSIRM